MDCWVWMQVKVALCKIQLEITLSKKESILLLFWCLISSWNTFFFQKGEVKKVKIYNDQDILIIPSYLLEDMMASQSSQLVGHLFCFSTPSVWRFRLNRLLAGPSAAIFNFTCFSSTGCENIQNTNKLLTAIDQSQLIPLLLLLHSDLIETNDPVENLRETRIDLL